jgi:UDP-N-acetylmuramoyl-L-alanyl-D-glutamate--2,6-diaminopimelate ligase
MSSVLPDLPISVSLHRLFPQASFVGCGDVVATDAIEDSRLVDSSKVFAAIPGTQVDGTQFVQDAINRGCPAILTEKPLANASVPQCVVPNARSAYARLCDAVVGHPAKRLEIYGVTGTNGKTTTNWLIRSILQSAGLSCGVLGTIEYNDGQVSTPATLTTPDPRTFSRWFRQMVDIGTRHAAIELSSHALDQGRVENIQLASAVVTNITQDHFDYHGTFEEYLKAKALIVDYISRDGQVAICSDDPGCRQLEERTRTRKCTLRTFGIEDKSADIRARIEARSLDGTKFVVRGLGPPFTIRYPLPGRHNVQNALGAICVASHAGIPNDAIVHGLEHIHQVPGRLESIDEGQPYHVFVDYAHTDDALRRVVQSLKQLTKGRVLCLFGAGGDRDRTKRPLLAQAASNADIAIVTSDNPRTENPRSIIEDVLAGFPLGYTDFHTELDRATAIRWTLNEAKPGDCVLIAGKGHEPYQIIGMQRLDFDDREIVKDILAQQALHTTRLHSKRRVINHR